MNWDVSFEGHQTFEGLQPSIQDDPNIGKLKKPRYVSNVTRAVSKSVSDACSHGSIPLTVGGDHSLAIGTRVLFNSASHDIVKAQFRACSKAIPMLVYCG